MGHCLRSLKPAQIFSFCPYILLNCISINNRGKQKNTYTLCSLKVVYIERKILVVPFLKRSNPLFNLETLVVDNRTNMIKVSKLCLWLKQCVVCTHLARN